MDNEARTHPDQSGIHKVIRQTIGPSGNQVPEPTPDELAALDRRSVRAFVKPGQSVLTVSSRHSVHHAAKKMRHHGVGCLVVIDEKGHAVGIVTERDLVHRLLACAQVDLVRPVSEIMSEDLASIEPHTSVTAAQAVMAERGIRHLPVIDGGLLVGMISSRDIMAYQVSTVRNLFRQHLREESHG